MIQDHRTQENREPDVGAFVIDQRRSVGWSQADLARHLDMDASNLSKIENNQRGLSAKKLLYIMELVQMEQKRRLRSGEFAQSQEQLLYNHVVPDMVRELSDLGVSEARVEGARASMAGIIKSAFAD